MSKNIINEKPRRDTTGTAYTGTLWDAPADGSRTNIALAPVDQMLIPNNVPGYGIYLDILNDQLADLSESLVIENDDDTPLAVTRRRWSQQKDKEWIDIYRDDEYENGCLKIHIKRACWLRIEGVVCTTGPGGTTTQSTGIGIRRHNGNVWIPPILAAATYTNEPGTDGLALPISSVEAYPAGTTLKIVIMTTHDIHTRNRSIISGTLGVETYFHITRMSTDY